MSKYRIIFDCIGYLTNEPIFKLQKKNWLGWTTISIDYSKDTLREIARKRESPPEYPPEYLEC